jgi:hypothetical protein
MVEEKEEVKFAQASWGAPTLGIKCPYCGTWDDYYQQVRDVDYPLQPFQNYEKEHLDGMEFQCGECNKNFELDLVQY